LKRVARINYENVQKNVYRKIYFIRRTDITRINDHYVLELAY